MKPHCAFLISACSLMMQASAWSWSPAISKSASAPKVSGHAVTAAQDRILLFGGLTGSAGSPTTDDLWVYERGNGWAHLPPQEDGPGRRMYAAAAVLGNSLYLFGGWDPGEPGSGGAFLDDIWCLSLDSMEWSRVEASLPFPLSRHSACTVGDKIVLHTHKGILLFSNGKVTERPTSGDGPEALSMCASAIFGDQDMLIFGGSTRTQELSSAAFVLDTGSWAWRKLKSKGEGPSARASPCAAFVGDNKCVIFGGAGLGEGGYAGGLIPQDDTWILTVNDDSAEWEKIPSRGSSPEGRVAASLTNLGDEFVLQGGWDPVSKGTFDQTWVLKK